MFVIRYGQSLFSAKQQRVTDSNSDEFTSNNNYLSSL